MSSLWMMVGVAVGVLFSAGFIPLFNGPFDSISQNSTEMTMAGTDWVLLHLSADGSTSAKAFALVVAVMAPGMVAFLLVVAANASLALRRVVGVVLLMFGFLSFMWLPWTQAAVVLVVCTLLAVLTWWTTGILLVVPLVATATALTIRFATALLADHGDQWNGQAAQMSTLIGQDAATWRWVLVGFASLPFLAAAVWALVPRDRNVEASDRMMADADV